MSALSWQSVRVRYGTRTALDIGPVRLEAGQLVALLGPNGSGKSSLLKALSGAVGAEVAELEIAGGPRPGPASRARHLSYLSQQRTGPALLKVREVVALGRHAFRGRDPDGCVEATIQRLDLAPLAGRRFGTLSGGEQARVLLGRALAVGAPVLLADEPTAALDPHYALGIMETLREETRRGALVVASLHSVELAQRYCDRALLLHGGSLHGQGRTGDVLSDGALMEVFRLRRGPAGWEPA